MQIDFEKHSKANKRFFRKSIAKMKLIKRINSKKGIFQMGEMTETQKKFNGIDHEDTTITISGHHVYVYYGYKFMRTFSEIVPPRDMYNSGFDDGREVERKRIGKEFKDWFYDKDGKDIIIEDAIKKITGIKL